MAKRTKKALAQERKHHPYSPSTLQNLEVCPMYRSRQGKEHIRTIAGTIAHGAAETGKDDHRLSDEDAAAVAECLDFVDSRRRMLQAQADAFWRADGCPKRQYKVTEMREAYLPIDDLKFPDGETATTAGYVDHVIFGWDKKYAEMIDWKFGLWPVEEANNNLQGLAYGLGLFKAYPELEKITYFFKQPLLGSTTEHTITRADIPAIYLRIQTVVARARDARTSNSYENARPMVPVCNFCDNIGKCPKVCEMACKVGRKFHPVDIPENITPTAVLSTADTSMGLRLAAVVEVWASAFKRQLNDRVLRQEAPVPPGYVLTSRQDREIVDNTLFQTVAYEFIRPGEFLQCCTPSLGKVEEIIKDRAERGQKSAAVREFAEALLAKGAVKLGQPYAFLRVSSSKSDNSNE